MFDCLQNYDQVKTAFDSDYATLWTYLQQDDRLPNFNSEAINQLLAHHKDISETKGFLTRGEERMNIRYSVLASKTEGVFNTGGHLALIKDLAEKKNRIALTDYGMRGTACIVNRVVDRHDIDSLITITLLQGQTLGAGLEAALTSDVVIAEKNTMVGLPEMMFNMFPGMGAVSMIGRKAGLKVVKEMIHSSKIYTAQEAYDMGLIDILVEEGEGVDAVYAWIKSNNKKAKGYAALNKALKRFDPITKDELTDITTEWVESAMNLDDRDFKIMARFIKGQEKRYIKPEAASVTNVVALKKTA